MPFLRFLQVSQGLAVALWLVLPIGCSNSSDAIELKRVALDIRQFTSTPRMLELPGYEVTRGMNLNVDLNIWGPLYWHNTVNTLIVGPHFGWVGWNFEVGLSSFDLGLTMPWGMDAYVGHWSQHGIDHPHPFVNFPVEDYVGLRFYLFRGSSKWAR